MSWLSACTLLNWQLQALHDWALAMETIVADTIRKSIRKTADFILLQKLLLFACTYTNNEIATSSGCYFLLWLLCYIISFSVDISHGHRDHIKCMEHLSELQYVTYYMRPFAVVLWVWNTTNFIMTMTNLLSTNVAYNNIVNILVSGYWPQHIADTALVIIIPYTLLRATYDKHEVQMVPFSQSWSHMGVVWFTIIIII